MTTVLIVDDHADFRATAHTLLEVEGYEVVGEAEDGVHAIRAAKDLRPDVVLLDVHLPDFDGFEVAARLSQLDQPPLVVLTSSRDQSDFGSLIDGNGIRGFVPKSELSGETLAAALG